MGMTSKVKRLIDKIMCLCIVYSGALLVIRWYCRKQVTILRYHRITDEHDPLFPPITLHDFEEQLKHLKRWYSVVTLEDAYNHLYHGASLPPNAVVLTLDDGYLDNYLYAYPLLRQYNLPATIYLITGSIGTGVLPQNEQLNQVINRTTVTEIEPFGGLKNRLSIRDNSAKVHAIEPLRSWLKTLDEVSLKEAMQTLSHQLKVPLNDPNCPQMYMTWEQVSEMSEHGIDFGAHCVTHPILTTLSEERVREEIVESVETVRERTGQEFISFCYPSGQFNEAVKRITSESGCPCATSVITGRNVSETDRFALLRLPVGNGPRYRFAVECTGTLEYLQSKGRQLLNFRKKA